MRTVANLPSLRGKRMFPVVQDAIRRAQRDSFRVVEFAVLGNHVHFIVEGDEGSDDRRLPLIRGIHGMAVRIAIAVNRTLARRGKVWRDRYHARALKTALQVKNCLRYVMHNGRKHYDLGPGIDLCSSGPWSSCWSEPPLRPDGPCPVVPARSWLLREGWRKLGPIGFDERPAMAGARQRSGTSQQHIGVKGMTAE